MLTGARLADARLADARPSRARLSRALWLGALLLAGCPASRVRTPTDAATADARMPTDGRADGPVTARDAAIDPFLVGQIPTSCGAPDQGLVPIDCTARGDADAFCVFGNHCGCSEGFRCEVRGDFEPECDPGVVCVPR